MWVLASASCICVILLLDTHVLAVLVQELSQWKFSETDTERLIFFENLFYLLDSDSNGLITTEEAATMLSFVNLSLSRTTLEETLDDAWEPKRLFDCGDFLEICVELMWTTPFKEILGRPLGHVIFCQRIIFRNIPKP